MPAGGLALASERPLFSAIKAGYDGNADDDLDDAGDNLAVNETFGSTTITPTYDANGNLTFDGTYKYTHDVWPLTRRPGDVDYGVPFFAYILRRANGTLYHGSTGDLAARLRQHHEGLVRSTRGLRPLRLVWFQEFATKQAATHREFSLKNGRTRRKTIEAMVAQFPPELIARFEAGEAALSRESDSGRRGCGHPAGPLRRAGPAGAEDRHQCR